MKEMGRFTYLSSSGFLTQFMKLDLNWGSHLKDYGLKRTLRGLQLPAAVSE